MSDRETDLGLPEAGAATALTERLLTLDGYGQRVSTYRFDLLNVNLEVTGTLPVRLGGSIENNINSTIKRSLSGMVLPPSIEAEVLNPLVARLRPVMVLSDGTEWPLGVFIFTDVSRTLMTGTSGFAEATLADQLVMLDQPVHREVSFRPGTIIAEAIERLLRDWGMVRRYSIEVSAARVSGTEFVTWAAGTSLLEILGDLCEMAGYYSVYFDNTGIAQVIKAPELASLPAVLRYGEAPREQRAVAGSIVVSDDLIDAPNRYIVVNNSLTDSPVSGYWDVPSSAPNSYANIGRIIAVVHDSQGVSTNADAAAAAKARGQSDASTYSWVSFDAVPDPRHDTFDIVSWNGINHREQSWSLPLQVGDVMKHELRRVYDEPTYTQTLTGASAESFDVVADMGTLHDIETPADLAVPWFSPDDRLAVPQYVAEERENYEHQR